MSGTAAPEPERRLAAIVAAEVEGYSRLTGLDKVGTLRTPTACRGIMAKLITEHRGRIANTPAEFPSAVDAVESSPALGSAPAYRNGLREAGLPE